MSLMSGVCARLYPAWWRRLRFCGAEGWRRLLLEKVSGDGLGNTDGVVGVLVGRIWLDGLGWVFYAVARAGGVSN